MRDIWTLACKDMLLVLRDKGGLFFIFLFPLIYASFFGLIFGGTGNGADGDRRLRVLLADEDGSAGSAAFVKTLEASAELSVTRAGRAEGVDLVRRGKFSACIVLPAGFGAARAQLFGGPTTVVEVATDPARSAEAGMINGLLTKYLFEQIGATFTDPAAMLSQVRASRDSLRADAEVEPGMRMALEVLFGSLETLGTQLADVTAAAAPATGPAGRAAWQPIDIRTISIARQRRGPRNAFAVSFPQGLIWGILGCTAAYGVSLVMERTRGTLRRLRIAPLDMGHVLAGKSLACLFTIVAVCAFLLLFAGVVFGVRPDSLPLLLLAIISVGVAFVGLMMLLSAFGANENSASGLAWGVLTVCAMLGGGMVPQMLMPGWMQTLGSISPVFWAIRALEGALWREFTLVEMALPCAVLLGMGVACFGLGVGVARRQAV